MMRKKYQKTDKVDGSDSKKEVKTENRFGDDTDKAESSNVEVDETYKEESCSSLSANPSTSASISKVATSNVNEAGPSHQNEAESELPCSSNAPHWKNEQLSGDPIGKKVTLRSPPRLPIETKVRNYGPVEDDLKRNVPHPEWCLQHTYHGPGNVSEALSSNYRNFEVEESSSSASTSRSELDEELRSGASSRSQLDISRQKHPTYDFQQESRRRVENNSTTKNMENPSTSRQIPSTSQETPSTSQETPSTSQETPSTSQETPSTSQETPSTSQETPSTSQETPSTSQETPSTSQEIPSTNREIESSFSYTSTITDNSSTSTVSDPPKFVSPNEETREIGEGEEKKPQNRSTVCVIS